MFRNHSWYFRNALVRANYRNVQQGIDPTTRFLILFLRNLLLNEANELRNRHQHVDWNDNSQEKEENSQENSQETPRNNPEKVLSLLKADSKITLQTIAKKIGVTRRTVQKITNQLKAEGKLRREGSTKAGKWIVISQES